MEAALVKAECDASSSEKILAAYAKAPDCEAVRETLMREKEKLILSLKNIRRILSESSSRLERCNSDSCLLYTSDAADE